MPRVSFAGFLEALREHQLLYPAQLSELTLLAPAHVADPEVLARELVRRGWLTAYQVERLFQAEGHSLVLGPYLLLERLGEGGMGQVFKARQRRLDRVVALKVIREGRLADPDAVRRFRNEARAAARLAHPNIVTVFDADEVKGRHFLAMEYVDGPDLARLVELRGPLPVARACAWVCQAASGLQHAHERGLVHRDIKPHNLLVTAQGSLVKILDMGLARLYPTAQGQASAESLTHEGAVLGTPDYLAPEQALDPHWADIRADIYSLGCTLYHLLTGHPPFPGGTFTQKLAWHLQADPPPVAGLRPEMPPGLAAVVGRMLAKRPETRYQTPAEVAEALRAFAREDGVTNVPVPARKTVAPQRGQATAAALPSASAPEAGRLRTAAPPTALRPTLNPLPRLGWRPRRFWPWFVAAGCGCVLLAAWLLWLTSGRPRPADPPPRMVLFGGPKDQRGTGLAVSGSALYVCGSNGPAALLVKYDLATLTPVWSKTLPENTSFEAIALSATRVYAVGSATPPACGAQDNAGDDEGKSLLAAYTSGGDLLGYRSPNIFIYRGGERYQAAVCVAQGPKASTYTAGTGEETGGKWALILAEHDGDGALRWKRKCGQGGTVRRLAWVNQSLYAVGRSENGPGMLLKLDVAALRPDGNPNADPPVLAPTWVRQTGSAGELSDVIGMKGALYAVGHSNGIPGPEGADYLIQKYDEAGALVWSKTFGGAKADALTGVVGLRGRLFAVGWTRSEGAGGADIVVMEIDPATGNTLSKTLHGGAADDLANGVATDGSRLYVVGESRSYVEGNNAAGESDVLVLSLPVSSSGP